MQGNASNVVLSDTLPATLSYVPGSATGSVTLSAGALTWNLGSLSRGASGSISFQATVNTGVTAGTLIAASASLACTEAPTPVNSTANITVSPTSPVLTLTATANQTVAAPGNTITFTLSYSATAAAASNVTITDVLPANLTYVTGSAGSNGSYSAGTLTWAIGNLSAGAGSSVTFQATINAGTAAGAALVNSANITCTQAPTPVTGTATVTVIPPVLTLTAAASPTVAAPGATITCTVTYSATVAGATNVTLTDALPANLTYLTGSASGGGTYAAGTLTWSLGHLNVGATGSLTFQATVAPGLADGTLIANGASITCNETPTPVTAAAGITVIAPLLTLTATASQSVAVPGAAITYTLHYSNSLASAGNVTLS